MRGKDGDLNRREFLGRSALVGAALGVNHSALGGLTKSPDENRPN